MYNDFYNPSPVPTPSVDSTWLIVSAVLAFVGGITAYFLFVSKKKSKTYSKFVSWLHDFLNFKVYFIDMILKITYIISTIYVTLSSFSFIGKSVALFFIILIFGNIFTRICYELILMMITIVNNTSEINNKLSNKKEVEKIINKTKKIESDED